MPTFDPENLDIYKAEISFITWLEPIRQNAFGFWREADNFVGNSGKGVIL